MKWIITADHINTGEGEKSRVDFKRAGRDWIERFRASDDLTKALMLGTFKADMTHEFRLYDDDDNLYYEGLCLDLDNQDGDSALQPLDWAYSDVGATRMDYRKKGDTEWSTL